MNPNHNFIFNEIPTVGPHAVVSICKKCGCDIDILDTELEIFYRKFDIDEIFCVDCAKYVNIFRIINIIRKNINEIQNQ